MRTGERRFIGRRGAEQAVNVERVASYLAPSSVMREAAPAIRMHAQSWSSRALECISTELCSRSLR